LKEAKDKSASDDDIVKLINDEQETILKDSLKNENENILNKLSQLCAQDNSNTLEILKNYNIKWMKCEGVEYSNGILNRIINNIDFTYSYGLLKLFEKEIEKYEYQKNTLIYEEKELKRVIPKPKMRDNDNFLLLSKKFETLKSLVNDIEKNEIYYRIFSSIIPRNEFEDIFQKLLRIYNAFYNTYSSSKISSLKEYRDREFIYRYWKDEKDKKVGDIYILSNVYMPGIVKIGKSNDVERRRKELRKAEGMFNIDSGNSENSFFDDKICTQAIKIPGEFKKEYSRRTILDLKFKYYGGDTDESCIEAKIHERLRSYFMINKDDYIKDTEFFRVPSVREAIIHVESELDKYERFLFKSMMKEKGYLSEEGQLSLDILKKDNK